MCCGVEDRLAKDSNYSGDASDRVGASVAIPAAAPRTSSHTQCGLAAPAQWTPGSWLPRRCWTRSLSIPDQHSKSRTCFKASRYDCFLAFVFTANSIPQRIKGALDARIAEEQARQRASTQTPRSRSGSTPKRSSSRTLSPSKRPNKGKDGDSPGKAASTGKGPDPSEFDPEFVIGDEDDQLSRAATPLPKEKPEGGETAGTSEGAEKEEDGKAGAAEGNTPPAPEIPPETRARLRKLDKLEPKYSGQC